MKDRRRTAIAPGQQVNFVLLEPDRVPPFEKITSVAVVPFTPEGRIVATVLDRGVDLPGGHVQETENTIEETARREALEEAGITLKDLFVVKVIQSDYYGSAPDDLTYMITLTAFVDAFQPFIPNPESTGRLVLDIEDFLAQYTAGGREWMRSMVMAAHARLFGGA
ncbi:MAG TPA: NUDIX domain-containing protein [Ktedonobacterales bacterium]|jgi:8-oxo-dGTP diphosphatase